MTESSTAAEMAEESALSPANSFENASGPLGDTVIVFSDEMRRDEYYESSMDHDANELGSTHDASETID